MALKFQELKWLGVGVLLLRLAYAVVVLSQLTAYRYMYRGHMRNRPFYSSPLWKSYLNAALLLRIGGWEMRERRRRGLTSSAAAVLRVARSAS